MFNSGAHLQDHGPAHRDCDLCGSANSAVKTFENEEFIYGSGGDQVALTATVPVWSCHQCGESFTDFEAEEIKHETVCDYLDRPTPRMIRTFREENGLTQDNLAKLGRFGIASIKRWESGEQIPTASAAQHLQLLMRPGTLGYLRQRTRDNQTVWPAPRFRTEITETSRKLAARFELRPTQSFRSDRPLIAA